MLAALRAPGGLSPAEQAMQQRRRSTLRRGSSYMENRRGSMFNSIFMAMPTESVPVKAQSEEEIWHAAFEAHDRKKEGRVSTHELGLLLRSMNFSFSNAELELMVLIVDADRNGFIEWNECKNLMNWWKRKEQLKGVRLHMCRSRFLRLLHRMRCGQTHLELEEHHLPPAESAPAPAMRSRDASRRPSVVSVGLHSVDSEDSSTRMRPPVRRWEAPHLRRHGRRAVAKVVGPPRRCGHAAW